MSSVGIHYRSYRKVVIGRASSVTSLDEVRLGVGVPSKKIEAAVAQRDEVRREERAGDGKIQAGPSARNKRAFKNWFLVDTRCPVARVPNSN